MIIYTFSYIELGSYPRNVQAMPMSMSSIVVQWHPPEELNGQVTGYKIYYTPLPTLPLKAWEVQSVDNNQLTTISNLQEQSIYSIRVQALTNRGPGPLSPPVQVKTQQGVPSQPLNLAATATSATTVQLNWNKPSNTGESIIGYEVYWNDTFTNQESKRAIPDVEMYTLGELYPDTLYYVWVAAKSRRGEGASTMPIPVKTDQYGMYLHVFSLVFISFEIPHLCFWFALFYLLFLFCPFIFFIWLFKFLAPHHKTYKL